MMLPVLQAILAQLDQSTRTKEEGDSDEARSKSEEYLKRMRAMLAMAICFSANVGGTGTIIGTPPNLVMVEFLEVFEENPITFANWMAYTLPQMLLCLAAIWLWLYVYYIGVPLPSRKKDTAAAKELQAQRRNETVGKVINEKYSELGSVTFHEGSVLALFVVLLSLWFFREPGFMPGWGQFFDATNAIGSEVDITDGSTAIFVVILLFMFPAHANFINFIREPYYGTVDSTRSASPSLIEWSTVQHNVPWGVILLLGGGLALADASQESCFSAWIGHQLEVLGDLPTWLISLIGSIIAAALTQVSSNTTAASIILPVLRDLSLSLNINPLYAMLPTTLACSYAFMFPISTGPNMITFGPSGMTTFQMVKVGFLLNVVCIGITAFAINTFGVPMFDLNNFPDWAQTTHGLNQSDLCVF